MHVLITGASKGIGFEVARCFAKGKHGVELSICSRNENELFEAQQAIAAEFPSVPIFTGHCDVSNEQDVEHFVRDARSEYGPIDVLVNNAGFGLFKAISDMSKEEFDRVLGTNLCGVFLMTRAVLPEMKQRRQGTIVTVSSIAGRNGFAGGAAYNASKFGVRGLMQSLLLDVREYDIRVITIFPGSVDTAFFDTAGHSLGSRANTVLRAQDVAQAIFDATLQRTGATISELDIRPTNP